MDDARQTDPNYQEKTEEADRLMEEQQNEAVEEDQRLSMEMDEDARKEEAAPAPTRSPAHDPEIYDMATTAARTIRDTLDELDAQLIGTGVRVELSLHINIIDTVDL